MTNAELDAETKRVYDEGGIPGSAFIFQKHIMLWIKVIGAERTKKCLAHAVDVFAAAVKKVSH
jgi:hypothetical protein